MTFDVIFLCRHSIELTPTTSIHTFLFDPLNPLLYPADCASGMLFRLGVSASKTNITQSPGFGLTSIVTWSKTPKTCFESVVFYAISSCLLLSVLPSVVIEKVLRSKKCFKALFSEHLPEVSTKKISRTLWQPVCRKDCKLGKDNRET